MTNGDHLNAYLDVGYQEAKLEADAHYAELYACFLATIPVELRRMEEYGPERPYGFNASAISYQFGLNFGDEYARTFAVFKFSTRLKQWRLVYFDVALAITPFYGEQARSKTLSGAILSAKEIWLNHQRRLRANEQQLPTGEGAIQ